MKTMKLKKRVSKIILWKNYINEQDRKANPSPKDCFGFFRITYSKQNFRGNIGLKFNPIPLFFINLDYNFGDVEGLSAGAGISIR